MYIAIGIFLFLIICFIVNKNIKNKYDNIKFRIEESVDEIDKILSKKKEFLIKIKPVINEEVQDEVLKDIDNLGDASNNLLNVKLENLYQELLSVIDDNDKLLNNESISNLVVALEDNDDELDASMKFYNESVEEFNKLRVKFPANIIALINKYHKYEFYNEDKNEMFQILD